MDRAGALTGGTLPVAVVAIVEPGVTGLGGRHILKQATAPRPACLLALSLWVLGERV